MIAFQGDAPRATEEDTPMFPNWLQTEEDANPESKKKKDSEQGELSGQESRRNSIEPDKTDEDVWAILNISSLL